MGVEKLLELCVDGCVVMGDFDKRITQAIGSISTNSIIKVIVNTNGVEASDNGTAFIAHFYAKAKSGTEEVSSGDFLMSRSYTENLRPTATNASKKTVENFWKKALPQKYVRLVVFENQSWSELFSAIFTFGISAFNVQEKRSIYTEN